VRPELEALAKAHPSRFQLHYTVDRAPDGWKYSTGFISKEMIADYLFSPEAGTLTQIFMCGPPPMIKVRFALYIVRVYCVSSWSKFLSTHSLFHLSATCSLLVSQISKHWDSPKRIGSSFEEQGQYKCSYIHMVVCG
jgi:NAD(P)H-flavin reductase